MNSDPDTHFQEDADYEETVDIRTLHAAAAREKGDPREGNEPLSLWFVVFFGAVLFFSGIYLALFSGGFKADSYSIYQGGGLTPPGGAVSVGGGPAKVLTLAEIGEKVFRQNCVACHQATGMGVAGVFPPLVGSDWVNGSEKRVAAILLHGVQGPIHVNGTVYNGAMPAWNQLSDEKIAGVITYIRQTWGNQAPEVTSDKIKTARELFKDHSAAWAEAELLAIPADAVLEAGPAPAPAPAG